MTERGAAVWAIVPAAGTGERFRGAVPKQYLEIANRAVIEWSVQALLDVPAIGGVVVPLAPGDSYWSRLALARDSRVVTCDGGEQRSDSVRQGLQRLGELGIDDTALVLVHDAVRPCLGRSDVERLLAHADPSGGAILAVPARDTLKRADPAGGITATVARDDLWHAMTPQLFALGRLRAALDATAASGIAVTDEAQAMECFGAAVHLVEGSISNIKLTYPADARFVEALLGARTEG